MLGGSCSQHVTGNMSWLNQPQSAIRHDSCRRIWKCHHNTTTHPSWLNPIHYAWLILHWYLKAIGIRCIANCKGQWSKYPANKLYMSDSLCFLFVQVCMTPRFHPYIAWNKLKLTASIAIWIHAMWSFISYSIMCDMNKLATHGYYIIRMGTYVKLNFSDKYA